MNEIRFWSMIESAWQSVDSENGSLRHRLAEGSLPENEAFSLANSVDRMVAVLHQQLEDLSQAELLAFDRILERKLYDIDRADIHEYTDGSDDGFLYCRGFIVAAGKEYYDAVNANPERAMMDLECEDMCFLSRPIYRKKFGEMPKSNFRRGTASNRAGWPELD